MPEPTSALSYADLTAHVGVFLGYGRGAAFGDAAWTTPLMAQIDDCVRSGCRKVYSPIPPYDWSFLHPYTTLTLPAGASEVQLPDDFAGIEGDVAVTSDTSSIFPTIRVTNPGRIKALFAVIPDATGRPQHAAIDAIKGTTLTAGQRQRLLVYPIADSAYSLTFQFYVVPDAPAPRADQTLGFPGIAVGNPYVYGGAIHAETFLEACLCVAEQRQDDMTGLHTQLFQERLLASMAVDRRSKGQYIGRNYDSSDDLDDSLQRHLYPNAATYNGASLS